jgi:hypothetical protein
MKQLVLIALFYLLVETNSFIPRVIAVKGHYGNTTKKYDLQVTGHDEIVEIDGGDPKLQPKMKREKQFQYQIEEDIDNLPHVSQWPNSPIYFKPGRKTRCISHNEQFSPLPLGEAIEFETDLFKGKIILRLRNIFDNVPDDHTEYFKGNKKFKNIVIQGQFKERLNMSDVWFGDVYEKPQIMSRVTSRLVIPFFQRMVTGVVMNFSSDKDHKVLVRMAGDAETLSINAPGLEPDMTHHDLPENVALLGTEEEFDSVKCRRKMLIKKKIASKYEYDPKLVYTFGFSDGILDFVTYSLLGKVSLEKSMNGNPFSITVQTTDQREIFRFNIFHELLTKYKDEL